MDKIRLVLQWMLDLAGMMAGDEPPAPLVSPPAKQIRSLLSEAIELNDRLVDEYRDYGIDREIYHGTANTLRNIREKLDQLIKNGG